MVESFSPIVTERLGWYVYALVDPRDGSVFYIGKGIGNRVFAHAAAAADVAAEPTAKLERIRAIHDSGWEVECFIIRHGIESERLAYEIEAAVIDTFRLLSPEMTTDRFQLANAVLGHRHARYGLAHASQVASLYDAPPAPSFDEPVLLLKIPGLWTPRMTAMELYEATRGWWVIGPRRRERARYACAVNKGVIRAVYRIESWRQRREGDRDWQDDIGKPARWGFDGVPAPEMQRYVDTSVAYLFKRGDANPVKLVQPTVDRDADDRTPGAPSPSHPEQMDVGDVQLPEVGSAADPLPGDASASETLDPLVETVAGALVRMTEWFRIEVHTPVYPEGAYVQVRYDDPDRVWDSRLLLEATGAMYLDPPLSPAQQARMRELGWDGPEDPVWMPSVNFERIVEADDIQPGPLARLIMTTLREVYWATDAYEYTLSPAPLGAEVVPDPENLELFAVVDGDGDTESSDPLPVDLISSMPLHPVSDQPAGLTDALADPEVFGEAEPWTHHLHAAWVLAAGARLPSPLHDPVPFPRGRLDPSMNPSALQVAQAQWAAVLHLLVYGCGWWRPGDDLRRAWHADAPVVGGRQWILWKVLPAWPGHAYLNDFVGWAIACGDDEIEAALPVPDDVRRHYVQPSGSSFDSSFSREFTDEDVKYRNLWSGQPCDPLRLTSHLQAPLREPGNPQWDDWHSSGSSSSSSADGNPPVPRLLCTVDTYEGWYLELCRRGMIEPDPILVSVHLRALGTLGTFRIGGGDHPCLYVTP